MDNYFNNQKEIRIRIKEDDLQRWNLDTVDKTKIKEWIKIGRERSKTNKRIDLLEKKLDSFINMMGQYSH